MYSLVGYGRMIGDRVRMGAYAEALRRAVKPGSVVMDLGTGPGICALLACRFGARRVYAVEPAPVIELARAIAAANGVADRVAFIEDLSTNIRLPESADVIVSDLRGVLPQFGRHLAALADARRRHLAPGGVLIPRQDVLFVGVVEAPAQHAGQLTPWGDNDLGFDLRPMRRLLSNAVFKASFEEGQLLTPPRRWLAVDYATDGSAGSGGTLRWTAARAGIGHGLACWLDATLVPGVGFSCAPGRPPTIYGQAYFPWPDAVAIEPGDTLAIDLSARPVGDDYVWRWDTRVAGAAGRLKADFRQSTFFGTPLAGGRLRKRATDHVPTANLDARIDRFVLDLLCESVALGEIASRLALEFPASFPDVQAALSRVGDLSERYSQ
jgi:protein arginine N-methyltransferase 1